MLDVSTVIWRRYIVSWWRALFLIAVVSTSTSAVPGTMARGARAAGLLQTGQTPLPYTGVTVSVPGLPFGVAATPDNNWLLVSITAVSPTVDTLSPTAPDGLAVLRRQGETMSLARVIHFVPGAEASDLALSSNRKIALVAQYGSPSRIAVVDVQRATSGSGHAVLGYITDRREQGSREVALSKNNRYAFATDEDTGAVTVMKLPTGRNPKYGPRDIVGRIPVDSTPTGITLSPGGQFLYLVCQQDSTVSTASGVLTVLSVSKAEHNPAHAVVARVNTGPGSDPVRVIVDSSGKVAWVTDRSLNVVKAYSTPLLRSDPSHALLATTPVGTAPVGIALVENGTVAAVANSNRFSSTITPETLSLLGTAAALAGKPALLGTLTVGAFPRELTQSVDGQTLFVTNHDSSSVTAFDVSKLPGPSGGG